MTHEFSRRKFIKAAGATAGFAVAAGFNPRSFAQNEKIKLGIIGTGVQGRIAHIGEGLTVNKDQIQIVAICDVWRKNLAEGQKLVSDLNGKPVPEYREYRDMLDKENLDAVLIATPLVTHYQIVMDCLDAGLYVFCEKTLTMTIEESRDIVKKCNETGKFLQVGHQRRYNPYYNKAMYLTNKNLIGRITHITAQWHRNDSWRRIVPKNYEMDAIEKKYITSLEKHVNWRLYNDMSAGLMTELGTHQLDVASWFMGSAPTRVSGFGGIEYWHDKRDAEDHVVLIYEWDVKPGDAGFKIAEPKRNGEQSRIKARRGYKVRMTYSSICTNSKSHYSELIQGDRGAFELVGEQRLQFYQEAWWPKYQAAMEERKKAAAAKAAGQKVAKASDEDEETKNSMIPGANENSGAPIHVFTNAEKTEVKYNVWNANHNQWAAFANDLKTGGIPKANQTAALLSAIAGHKGNEAIRTGTTIDIDPALSKFDFEIPDPFRYDDVPAPKPDDPIWARLKLEEEKKAAEEAGKEKEA